MSYDDPIDGDVHIRVEAAGRLPRWLDRMFRRTA